MDLTTTKMADTESETPPRSQSQPIKPLSFTNGTSLKKNLHHNHPPAPPPQAAAEEVVEYKECLKNHAASLGGHALDGCGEFMPSPNCTPTDPTSLKCAACGCHRNFHRRDESSSFTPTAISTHFLEFRHHPPPLQIRRGDLSSSPSPPPSWKQQQPPPPISYAPHMLLALSTAVTAADEKVTQQHQIATPGTPTAVKTENHHQRGSRKRFRTKFSQEQKDKMSTFAEKLGWKMQRSDEETVAEFCNEVGIRRGVLKVWMHNNKNTFGKKEKDNYTLLPTSTSTAAAAAATNEDTTTRNSFDNENNNNNSQLQVSTNGSSSSS